MNNALNAMSSIRTILTLAATVAATIAVATSCSDDEHDGTLNGTGVGFDVSIDRTNDAKGAAPAFSEIVPGPGAPDSCTLLVSVSDRWPESSQPESKASLENTASIRDNSYPGFGLFQFNGSTAALDNIQYKYTSGEWKPQSGTGAQWPGSGSTTFYAYAPYVATYSGTTSASGQTINFTASADNASQTDLLVASVSASGNSSGRVSLAFDHALTAVRFVAGTGVNLDIKRIQFQNIKATGTYSFVSGLWTDLSGNQTFSIEFSAARPITGSTSLPEITYTQNTAPNDEYFFLLPQSFTDDNQKIIITLDDDSTVEFPLKGSSPWVGNTTVTYQLSKSAPATYYFKVSNNVSVLYTGKDAEGNDGNFTITSTKTPIGGGPTEAVPFTLVEFQKYNTSTNTFVTDASDLWLKSVSSPVSGSPISVGIAPATAIGTDNVSDYYSTALSQQSELGTPAAPYDLSRYNPSTAEYGARNTANCYVIQAPGYYMFPLVYGNAIQNDAVHVTSDMTYWGSVDNQGNEISATNYYLGCSPYTSIPSRAEFIWQDAAIFTGSNLFQIISPSGSDPFYYVSFYVDRNKIHQGNVLLAVYNNSNEILWSWHLWFTPVSLKPVYCTYTSSGNYGGTPVGLMSVNLGWEERTTALTSAYPQTVGKLIYKQNGSNALLEVLITQQAYTDFNDYMIGVCPSYQWGRNTPFAPYDNNGGDWYVTMYDNTGNTMGGLWAYQDMTTVSNHKYKVLNPMSIYGDNLYSSFADPAWRDNVKTILDPCPVGYRVPTKDALTPIVQYIRDYLSNTTEPSKTNSRAIYREKRASQETAKIFFPKCGPIKQNGFASSGDLAYYVTTTNNGFEAYHVQLNFPVGHSMYSPSFEIFYDFDTQVIRPMVDD